VKFTLLYQTHMETAAEKATSTAYAEIVEQVIVADEVGFSGVWFAEHHFGAMRGRVPAPLLMALRVGVVTRRIRVGTAVLLVPLHNPVDLAEQIAMTDVLTGGRLDVGVGSGGDPLELEAFGISADERRARFQAAATVLRRLLEGHAEGIDEPPFSVPAVGIEPLPLQKPSSMLWMASMSDASCTLAGQLGDHLLLARGIPEERLREQISVYRQARVSAGHDEQSGNTQVTRGLYVARTDEQAWIEAAPGIERYYRQSKKVAPGAPVPDLREMARQSYFIIGDPDTCVQQIRALGQAASLSHLACDMYLPRVPHEAILRSIRLCGERVISRVADTVAVA